MAIPPLTDAQIDRNSPLDQAAMREGYRDRNDWNWQDADNGGAGIAASVQAFIGTAGAFGATGGHTHDGTAGQGANIDSAGIAAGAVLDPDMIQTDAVATAKIAATTIDEEQLAAGAVTEAKMSGQVSVNVSGSQAWDVNGAPFGDDEVFQGDVVALSSISGVACNFRPGANGQVDFFIRSSSPLKLGLRSVTYLLADTGTWDWNFDVVG